MPKSSGLYRWQAFPPDGETKREVERLVRMSEVKHLALMPDLHVAGRFCIGVAAATDDIIIPDLVGGDIGCGILALELGEAITPGMIQEVFPSFFMKLREQIPALWNRGNSVLPESLAGTGPHGALGAKLHTLARKQLGTLGRGNHFLELQLDENGSMWIMVHTGSRGVGQAVTQYHCEANRMAISEVVSIQADSPRGRAYMEDHDWALRFARVNREQIARTTVDILNTLAGVTAAPVARVESVHNFLAREAHFGEELLVHRKGANYAGEGTVGIIAGSMGGKSFHVRGRGNEAALSSSSHGAGRRLSRGKARHTISRRQLHESMSRVLYDHAHQSRYLEDAPSGYKDITKVMRAQKGLVRRVRTLTPILNYKA